MAAIIIAIAVVWVLVTFALVARADRRSGHERMYRPKK